MHRILEATAETQRRRRRGLLASVLSAAGCLFPVGPSAAQQLPEVPPERDAAAPMSLAEAIRSTLRRHPAIADARANTRAATAGLGLARGRFDPVLSASAGHEHDRFPLLPGDLISDSTDVTLGASAAFRWGMTVTPSVSLQRLHERTEPPIMGMAADPVQRARADLTVTQPLLRGAGTEGAASDLTAARHDRQAAALSATHVAQAQVLSTLLAYWNLVAAERDVALFERARQRAEKLVEDTSALVEAEQRPPADLRQFEGNLANRTRAVLEAESSRLTALQQLGLAMGRDPRTTRDWRATNAFPPPTAPPSNYEALVQHALGVRQDVQAAMADVAAAKALVAGADHNVLPALDFSVSVGYAGAVDDDGVGPLFEATGRNVSGANGSVRLSLELPVTNEAARAERDLRVAQLRQAQIARDDLERQVRADVRIALDEQRVSASTVLASQQAVEHFRQAIDDERAKLLEGLSTVIDVVQTEDQLTSAELALTSNLLRHAIAQARLRFAVGGLPSLASEAPRAARAIARAEAPYVGD